MTVEIDAHVGPNDHYTIKTPNATIYISHFTSVGTQIAVYDDPDQNPVAMIHLKEESDAGSNQGNGGQRSSVVTPLRRRPEGGPTEVG